mmetsp:Transcript_12614/g.29950  ORF Transcript_12614/g.29950 Transcript_12614/m.29950 type:complete len:92 (-) Transcript_12614:96-371(-)
MTVTRRQCVSTTFSESGWTKRECRTRSNQRRQKHDAEHSVCHKSCWHEPQNVVLEARTCRDQTEVRFGFEYHMQRLEAAASLAEVFHHTSA